MKFKIGNRVHVIKSIFMYAKSLHYEPYDIKDEEGIIKSLYYKKGKKIDLRNNASWIPNENYYEIDLKNKKLKNNEFDVAPESALKLIKNNDWNQESL